MSMAERVRLWRGNGLRGSLGVSLVVALCVGALALVALRPRLAPQSIEFRLYPVPVLDESSYPYPSPWTQLQVSPQGRSIAISDFVRMPAKGVLRLSLAERDRHGAEWKYRTSSSMSHFLMGDWDEGMAAGELTWGWQPLPASDLHADRYLQLARISPVGHAVPPDPPRGMLCPSWSTVLPAALAVALLAGALWHTRKRWAAVLKARAPLALLVLVLGASLYLSWSVQVSWLDETTTAHGAFQIVQQGELVSLGGRVDVYGRFTVYQQAALTAAYFLRQMKTGGFVYLNPLDGQVYAASKEGPKVLMEAGAWDKIAIQDLPPSMLMPSLAWGRYAMGVWMVLSVLATFLIGRRFLGDWGALCAACILAFWPDLMQYLRYVKANSPALLVPLLVQLYCLRLKQDRLATVLGAGALAGLAMTTRYQTAVILLTPWIAILFDNRRNRLTYLILSTLAALGVFCALSPSVLFDLPSFLNILGAITSEYYFFETSKYTTRFPSLFFLRYLFLEPLTYGRLGWLVGGMGLAGLALLCVPRLSQRSLRDHLVLLSYGILVFLAVTSPKKWNVQFYFPLFPYLCLGYAAALVFVARWARGRTPGTRRRVAVAGGVALLLAVTAAAGIAECLRWNRFFAEPLARNLALEWVTRHVPFGSTLLMPQPTPTYRVEAVQAAGQLYRVVEVPEAQIGSPAVWSGANVVLCYQPVPVLEQSRVVHHELFSGRGGYDVHPAAHVYDLTGIVVALLELPEVQPNATEGGTSRVWGRRMLLGPGTYEIFLDPSSTHVPLARVGLAISGNGLAGRPAIGLGTGTFRMTSWSATDVVVRLPALTGPPTSEPIRLVLLSKAAPVALQKEGAGAQPAPH